MSLLVDLADVPTKDRSSRWCETIRGEYHDVDIRFDAGSLPAGKIVRSFVGPVALTAATSVAQTHERTRAMAKADHADYLMAAVQFGGHSHIEQYHREVDLRPGQLAIFDVAEAYRYEVLDESNLLMVTIPRVFFPGVRSDKNALVNVLVDEQRGSEIVADFFRSMTRENARLSLEQQEKMTEFGIRLLLDATAASAGMQGRRSTADPAFGTLWTGQA